MQELLGHLRSVGTTKLYRRGSSIYFQGEVPRYALYILDGVVKAYTISPNGDETIVHLFGKGAVIPICWVNTQSPTTLFNYDALNDVRAVAFKRSDLESALEQNPGYEKEYRHQMSRAQTALLLRVTGLTQNRAIDKICYTLYYLLFRYGIEKSPDVYEIDLKITQGLLAQLIGQTRESTAKNIKLLKKAGVVDYNSLTYSVNKRKLENFLGEDSFRQIVL